MAAVRRTPAIYDALDVPLAPAVGKLGRSTLVIIDMPDGKHPIMYVWGEMVPGIGPAAAAFSQAVYEHTTLGLREFEAARLRIAQINGCLFCQDWRTERDGEKVEDSFDEAVTEWRTTERFDDRTRLAAEYAERYALDHHGLDDEFWARMKADYTDQRDRRAVDVPRLVAGLRPPQPRPRPRHRLRPPRPLTTAVTSQRRAVRQRLRREHTRSERQQTEEVGLAGRRRSPTASPIRSVRMNADDRRGHEYPQGADRSRAGRRSSPIAAISSSVAWKKTDIVSVALGRDGRSLQKNDRRRIAVGQVTRAARGQRDGLTFRRSHSGRGYVSARPERRIPLDGPHHVPLTVWTGWMEDLQRLGIGVSGITGSVCPSVFTAFGQHRG